MDGSVLGSTCLLQCLLHFPHYIGVEHRFVSSQGGGIALAFLGRVIFRYCSVGQFPSLGLNEGREIIALLP